MPGGLGLKPVGPGELLRAHPASQRRAEGVVAAPFRSARKVDRHAGLLWVELLDGGTLVAHR